MQQVLFNFWGGGGRNNVYYKTEMLTATVMDDTVKHQPSLPNSTSTSSKANSQKMPHILWKFVVDECLDMNITNTYNSTVL
jgi:hypothetical protein